MGPTNRTPVRGAARLAAILDALPDALLLVDGSGAIVNANSAALNLFEGESAQRLLGKLVAEVLPGYGRTVATAGSAPAALPAGVSAAETTSRISFNQPVRRPPERMAARRTDGGLFPAEVTTAELGEDDDAGLTLLVVRDLSGVIDVENELRRQQRQIELILRAASEGIIGVDHEGRIVLVNPAGAKILRYRAVDLGGQDAHDLLTHSRADGTPLPEDECLLLDSVRTGAKHRAVDSVLWRSDGGPVYVDLTTAPVYEGENIIGAVMTFVDNSANRAAERQAEELADVLSELRGGLDEVAARAREYADYAAGYGSVDTTLEDFSMDLERLSVLAADVEDFQQSVIGTSGFEPEPVELADLVEAAVAEADPVARSVGVELAAHCAEVDVELDPRLFVKLLVHLLADMVSASPVGGKVVVTAARRGALARIEIRGPHTGGGPLHLPIAQALAARHGGTVTTHRIAGKGNTHVVEVPVTQAARAEAKQSGAKVNGTAVPAVSAQASARGYGAKPAAAGAAAGSDSSSGSVFGGATATSTANAVEAAPAAPEPPPEVPKANGHHTPQGAERRRRTGSDARPRIPAQSRSTLSRSVGSLEDLRPTKPRPTGDVWSKPERANSPEPPPPGLEQHTGTPREPELSGTDEPWQVEPEFVEPPQAYAEPPQVVVVQPEPHVIVEPRAAEPRGRRRAAGFDPDASGAHPTAPQPAAPQPIEPPPIEPEIVTPIAPMPPPAVPKPHSAPPPLRFADTEPDEPENDPGTFYQGPDAPRLLLWPDPDAETARLLRVRGYDPIALGEPDRLPIYAANGTGQPHPFAVFVDPIAAPITRRGLRELRNAATRAGLPMLVTAGIGCAADARDLGPDPSLLLTALCPDGVRLPRVLLVEARADLADALSDILERQGMQVSHATTDAESRESAVAAPPDLVLLDLMQIRRRRVGVVDWLRDRGLLSRTPLVVYTAEATDTGGFDSLYLTERATDAEPAGRIGDLLAKIAP